MDETHAYKTKCAFVYELCWIGVQWLFNFVFYGPKIDYEVFAYFSGNRWILPIWTKTPHCQPPLDLTELKEEFIPAPAPAPAPHPYYPQYPVAPVRGEEFLELQYKKSRESDL